MPGPSWYLARLGRMTPPEVAYRAVQFMQGWWQRIAWHNEFLSSVSLLSSRSTPWFPHLVQAADDYDLATADAILEGRFRLLGLSEIKAEWPPDWNRDPKSKTKAPLKFGKHIDYRNAEAVGDIKYIWELNRHLELPILANAYKRTGEEKYLKALEHALTSWLRQCPFPLGVNWCSALECAIRIINWALMWQLLGGKQVHLFSSDESQHVKTALSRSIEHHLLFIQRNYSRFSSANNHLIGEAAGVFVACNTWSFGGQSVKWASNAKSILVNEALRQIGTDGVGKEQAVGYVPFVLEFLLIVGAVAQTSEIRLPDEYWQRICSALDFLDSISDSTGNIANFGDSDDGAVIRIWGYNITSRIQGLRRLANSLIEDVEMANTNCRSEQTSDNSITDAVRDTNQSHINGADSRKKNAPIAFTAGGYYVLQASNRCKEEIHCVFDCGALGYLATAAHGHADALSIIMSVDGHKVLVDSGTYAYHTERAWRDYFRGTAAHNTVTIDKLNQSEIAGSFMWRRTAQARCELCTSDETVQTVKASHDGYLRLEDPLFHRRQVELNIEPQQVVVTDNLICQNTHFVELNWHLAPDCLVVEENTVFRVTAGMTEIRFRLVGNANLSAHVFRGSENPICGWYSDEYDRKVPTSTLCWSGEISGATELRTEIDILRRC